MVFIKKVLIQGFKSYKDQTDFDEFHQQVNVIVGRNGSGKSNFFSAIRFVLSDMFTNLDREERQRLLHEGSGDTVLSAYVEIHFDNKDGRFPIDKEEVVLRRTIGLKKDEFILDKKRVTVNDVVNLFESAGFSRSNPYYIVQQGKVTALTLMKDAERLDLLKEVAGARVYDDRRKLSFKILEDTDGKRKKIDETLGYITEKLEELQQEKEELRDYQRLDKQRRAIQYNIYDKELTEALQRLETIESERHRETSKANTIYEQALTAREELRDTEKKLKNLTTKVQSYSRDKDNLMEEKQEYIKQKANLQLKIKDEESKLDSERTKQTSYTKKIAELEKAIAGTKEELEGTKQETDKQRDKERKINDRLSQCNRRVTDLYAKQGRGAQFKSKKERDDWIQKEVKTITGQVNEQKDLVQQARKSIASVKDRMDFIEKAMEEGDRNIEKRKTVLDDLTKQINDLKDKRDHLSNKRKELWKKDGEIDANVQLCKTELQRSEQQLQSSVAKMISTGLMAVTRIVEQYPDLAGVHGPLIDLFECDDMYTTAVEVTAGNSLFHVVVDTDETAAKILEIMNSEKIASRLTFIPLNKLNVHAAPLPTGASVRPMIEEIKPTSPVYKKAFQQIFGKTLICRDLETAANFARTHNLDCVTLEGDQVNKKGAITGGYYDIRTSRLEAAKSIKRWKAKVAATTEEAKKVKKVLQDIDQQVSLVVTEMQQLEERRASSKTTMEQLSIELKDHQKESLTLTDYLQQQEYTLATLESSLKQLEESRKSLQDEIGTDLLARLSDKEQAELTDLNLEVADLKKQLITLTSELVELEARKSKSQNLLTNDLMKRLDELHEEVNAVSLTELEQELAQDKTEIKKVQANIDDLSDRVKVLEDAYDENTKQIKDLRDALDEKKSAELKQTKELQKESERMEKLLNERSLLLQKKEDAEAKIREIGSLPSAEVDQYKNTALTELMSHLHDVNKQLRAKSKVNKKAFDQWTLFTDQKDDLTARKEKLDESHEAILGLINSLDQKKDEAIERTFKGVAYHFSAIFSDLVPGGAGSLIMQKKVEEGRAQFTGVSIRVKFSEADEPRLMNALSGGQKSLVALALIFAIQRCDPAPFYLFDEIDSALDATYRVRVARIYSLIKQQSKTAEAEKKSDQTQFIVSTFRPELVNVANKCYGITFRNKESTIHPITKEEAQQIIQEEMVQSEQAPAVPEEEEEEEEDEEQEEAGEQ